ncbi:DUF4307 domain-containing protein [Glycomyces mayteni]|uniref:DUF4307 domain-containing protein n=1 Tax=Glycomyces mayteni TaxID=543887 RepID=A0ABW2DAX2_9ACTN|nr:hypothetical protein GCM10025732_17280 [Glycomyces mayteni]
MTETQTTDGRVPETADVSFPDGRYGHRREPSKRRPGVTAVLTAGVITAGVVAAWLLVQANGQNDVTERLLAYDDSIEGQVAVTFEVYKPAGEGATCAVRSRDLAGAEIGYAEVEVPADDSTRVEMTYVLPVEGDANTGEVLRCWQAD